MIALRNLIMACNLLVAGALAWMLVTIDFSIWAQLGLFVLFVATLFADVSVFRFVWRYVRSRCACRRENVSRRDAIDAFEAAAAVDVAMASELNKRFRLERCPACTGPIPFGHSDWAWVSLSPLSIRDMRSAVWVCSKCWPDPPDGWITFHRSKIMKEYEAALATLEKLNGR